MIPEKKISRDGEDFEDFLCIRMKPEVKMSRDSESLLLAAIKLVTRAEDTTVDHVITALLAITTTDADDSSGTGIESTKVDRIINALQTVDVDTTATETDDSSSGTGDDASVMMRSQGNENHERKQKRVNLVVDVLETLEPHEIRKYVKIQEIEIKAEPCGLRRGDRICNLLGDQHELLLRKLQSEPPRSRDDDVEVEDLLGDIGVVMYHEKRDDFKDTLSRDTDDARLGASTKRILREKNIEEQLSELEYQLLVLELAARTEYERWDPDDIQDRLEWHVENQREQDLHERTCRDYGNPFGYSADET